MMLTISLRLPFEEKEIDIMVDGEQKICSTLKVLAEAGILNKKKTKAVRSLRSRERIDTSLTYKEGHIYNGDIICIEA